MATKKITEEHAQVAYQLARDAYRNLLEESDAVSTLVDKHGMNPSSAEMYIGTLKYMLEGRRYMRTINAYATEFYLEGIRQDFGEKYFKNALDALKLHYVYLEGLEKGNRYKLREIHQKYFQIPQSESQSQNAFNEEFHAEVNKSQRMSESARYLELSKFSRKPQKTIISVTSFIRNPHVVADVLLQAKGKCEECGNLAPFIRARDNSPYLEVHHKIRLADGGHDTIENALALCPNCHREAHFGK